MQPGKEEVKIINVKRLKEIRKEKGLTQKEVADGINISRPMYTSIENGNRNPSLKVMQNIVEFFGEESKDVFFN